MKRVYQKRELDAMAAKFTRAAPEEVKKRLMHGNFQPNVGLGFKLFADSAVLVHRVQGEECIG